MRMFHLIFADRLSFLSVDATVVSGVTLSYTNFYRDSIKFPEETENWGKDLPSLLKS